MSPRGLLWQQIYFLQPFAIENAIEVLQRLAADMTRSTPVRGP